MDATGTVITTAEPAAPVRWEPCAEPRLGEAVGTCSSCGWPVDDHGAERLAAPPRAA
ncbi:MAG TPA: hypothetical protein VG869_01180 [Acidimicrobiia bacterium]|jgi:hypothetical protein|nr:hypothetical protein [Acidimicrobiia bacterium]